MTWDMVADRLCRNPQDRITLEGLAIQEGLLCGLVAACGKPERVAQERKRQMLEPRAGTLPIWAEAVERTCDELLYPVPSGSILIVDRDAQRVQLLKEILTELHVNVDKAVRVVDRFPDPGQSADRYDLIIRDPLLGVADTTSLPRIGWQLAQPMLTSRGRVFSCFPNPSFYYEPYPNEVRPTGTDRQALTHQLRDCLRRITHGLAS
jgi:hypothetical protein